MVEALSSADVRAAGLVLARAFRDNPAMTAVLKGDDADVRLRVLEPCMIGFAEAVRRYGVAEVVKESGSVSAVSLSFPPNGFPPPVWAQLIGARGPIAAVLARSASRIDYADATPASEVPTLVPVDPRSRTRAARAGARLGAAPIAQRARGGPRIAVLSRDGQGHERAALSKNTLRGDVGRDATRYPREALVHEALTCMPRIESNHARRSVLAG